MKKMRGRRQGVYDPSIAGDAAGGGDRLEKTNFLTTGFENDPLALEGQSSLRHFHDDLEQDIRTGAEVRDPWLHGDDTILKPRRQRRWVAFLSCFGLLLVIIVIAATVSSKNKHSTESSSQSATDNNESPTASPVGNDHYTDSGAQSFVPVEYLQQICSPQLVIASDEGRAICQQTCEQVACCDTGGCSQEQGYNCPQYQEACSVLTQTVAEPAPPTDGDGSVVTGTTNQGPSLPIPNAEYIQQICSPGYFDNDGVADCKGFCELAECCYRAPGEVDSCLQNNQDACTLYAAPCTILKQYLQEYKGHKNDNPIAITDLESPDLATLQTACSVDSIATEQGRTQCQDLCNPAQCCNYPSTSPNSCLDRNYQVCLQYHSACNNLNSTDNTGDTASDNGEYNDNPDMIETACAPENLATSTGVTACQTVCAAAACCLDDSPEKTCVFDDNCLDYDMCLKNEPDINVPLMVEEKCAQERILTERGAAICSIICIDAICCFPDIIGGDFDGDTTDCSQNTDFCAKYTSCANILGPYSIAPSDTSAPMEDGFDEGLDGGNGGTGAQGVDGTENYDFTAQGGSAGTSGSGTDTTSGTTSGSGTDTTPTDTTTTGTTPENIATTLDNTSETTGTTTTLSTEDAQIQADLQSVCGTRVTNNCFVKCTKGSCCFKSNKVCDSSFNCAPYAICDKVFN